MPLGRTALAYAATLVAALGLASCGGDQAASGGDAVAGKRLFAANGCGGCHTSAAAASRGTGGPDLDAARPSTRGVMRQLRLPSGFMVAVVAWRLRDDRGEALRDLLMHPRGRAFARAESDILSALPRLIVAVAGRRRHAGMSYHGGTFGLSMALAFTPVVVTEAAALHLLAGGGIVAWILTALHAYALLWLWGFLIGPRAYPHRIGAWTAVLRGGPMYRVALPPAAVASVVARTERVRGAGALTERDGAVLLAARGRVDVWLELAEPVRAQRPLHEPLVTRRLAVASDDPQALVERLLARSAAPAARGATGIEGALGLLAALDLAGLGRDALQPG